MKNILPLVIIGLLTISSLQALAYTTNPEQKQITCSIKLSPLQQTTENTYLSITLPEATSYRHIPGEPVIPKITKTFILPYAATINDIDVTFSNTQTIQLQQQIIFAQPPQIDGIPTIQTQQKNKALYSQSSPYPETPYTYYTTSGLSGKNHVVFLSITCYPIQYIPADNTLFYSNTINIDIGYSTPQQPVTFGSTYELLIIAPEEYASALQPLVDHKINKGMTTKLVTLEEIATNYTTGRDAAENIKLFIYDSINPAGLNWGVIYVLLVGGMEAQLEQWITPVRYTNNHASIEYETGVLCDLYFADLLKGNGTVFEDWDSNGNGIFAEFTATSKDIIDGSPDIYIGRLACRTTKEVTTLVNKIINYESSKADPSWFKKMILAGGDTYPNTGPSYEAEIDTNVSASYMPGFEFERLWASTGALTGQRDFEKSFSNGAGFVHTAGHANPCILVTHPPESEAKITIMHIYNIPPLNAMYALLYQGGGISGFIEKLLESWMPRLRNQEKQPVVVVGGCHNSQYNTSYMNILKTNFSHAYGYGIYVPKCWSWWLTSKSSGGAIATMGNTGLGKGLNGFNYPNGLDGWLFPRFFYNYGMMDKTHVGEAHSAAITDYVLEFDINSDDDDRQMVEQWALLGDPSLMIGGYD